MNSQWLRAGAGASFLAAALLVIQMGIASALGSELILLETSLTPARVSAFLQTNATVIINLMIADNLFVVAYTVGLLGLVWYAKARQRIFAFAALLFVLLTAASDFTENSLTIVLTRLSASGSAVEINYLVALQMLAQLKFLWIYVAVALFAVLLWDETRLGRVVAILFLLFPLIGVLAPASVTFALLRIVWMLVLLVAGGIFLWRRSGQRINESVRA